MNACANHLAYGPPVRAALMIAHDSFCSYFGPYMDCSREPWIFGAEYSRRPKDPIQFHRKDVSPQINGSSQGEDDLQRLWTYSDNSGDCSIFLIP